MNLSHPNPRLPLVKTSLAATATLCAALLTTAWHVPASGYFHSDFGTSRANQSHHDRGYNFRTATWRQGARSRHLPSSEGNARVLPACAFANSARNRAGRRLVHGDSRALSARARQALRGGISGTAGDSFGGSAGESRSFAHKLAATPAVYGNVVVDTLHDGQFSGFPANGNVDRVLTFRNIHNWIKDGQIDANLRAFYAALKPGGILGVEEHRAALGTSLQQTIKTGYVTEDYVIQHAQAAGFQLASRSEVNSNPRDTKNYPNGVWSLPPTYEGGNVDLVTLALNLYTQGVDPELDFSNINKVARTAEECTQLPIHPRHPYVGDLFFTAFSGSHQDAIKKSFAVQKADAVWEIPYLPIDPSDLGRMYDSVIRVNSQSGKGGIAYLLEQSYGVVLPLRLQVDFSSAVQRFIDDSGQEVTPAQIWELFQQEYVRITVPIH